MQEAFKDIVPVISAIGTHSLRSDGAIAAANAGLPDPLCERHGRWASESAKDGYIQDFLSPLFLWYLVFSCVPLFNLF